MIFGKSDSSLKQTFNRIFSLLKINLTVPINTYQEQKIFVHCAANLRVSAFMYLYRTLYQNISEEKAKQDLHKLWQPNATWQNLIDRIME